ncbi:hypothetical protein QBC38DRAFT_482573 [Podospora fimiseda]|uniref:Uncharacterized protein n=1 Tax=Podospora fimiseda TaxID=252190 RepID=A0AAN7GVA0_9PEZI|nr:hypothetical protein QBC38DRAFT_482573 [Podospora fimiseda]
MSVFVNYGRGPKLDRKQRQVVRSQAMVAFRGKQREERGKGGDATVLTTTTNPRRLAPAVRTESESSFDDDDEQQQTHRKTTPNTSRKRTRQFQNPSQIAQALTKVHNPYDMRTPPPHSTHNTGVDSRTFSEYLTRCTSYSSYLDEAFILVGFKQQSYFRPDMSKAACIYIGWLLTAGVLDAFKGGKELSYPLYEYRAVSELQRFIDAAKEKQLGEVVYPVVILGMFEMVRFSPRTITHLAAVERFVKTRGGLGKMPIVMQHLVIMGDILESICLHTPLAFNELEEIPPVYLVTPPGHPFYPEGQFRSSPFFLVDADMDFLRVSQFVSSPEVGIQLGIVLQEANDIFQRFFGLTTDLNAVVPGYLDAVIDSYNDGRRNDLSKLLLETCALATRIMKRTLEEGAWSARQFDNVTNERDVLAIYDNVRFMGLRVWAGLPYVYVWVNLIGFVASRDMRMRSYFIAEVVRCAFSYGCYQMEVYQGVLKNFLQTRRAVESSQGGLNTLF